MGWWTDIAEKRGPTVNEGDGDGRASEAEDRAVEQRGVVLHIADGYYEGTIAWQRNDVSDVSSQFVVAGPRDVPRGVPDGRAGQVVDTDIRAWTQRDGNGHWISIECSGFSGDALSAAQIEACARILAKGHQVYGYPLQLATSPAGRGLGHHSMGTNGRSVPTDTWTGPSWGHEQCPGPRVVAQKPAILARAIQLVNGVNPPQEDDMPLPKDFEPLSLQEFGRVAALIGDQDTVGWTGAPVPDELNVAKLNRKKEHAELLAAIARVTQAPVDAGDVAAALAADAAFRDALATAVADKLAQRLGS